MAKAPHSHREAEHADGQLDHADGQLDHADGRLDDAEGRLERVHRRLDHAHGTPAAAATCASVALDIGAGRGALVLYPGERFRGREIEISPVDGDGCRVHTGVHERTTHARSLLTAVFGSLPAGEYVVWEDATTAGPIVGVQDGAVAEMRLG